MRFIDQFVHFVFSLVNFLQGDNEQLRFNLPGLRNDPWAFHFAENKLISRKESGVNTARENSCHISVDKEIKVQFEDGVSS